MRLIHSSLATLAALCLAAGAHGRSPDCSRPATELDRTICSDPELRDYDQRIAAAYGQALASWNGAIADYVRRDQQEWLTAFRTIETLDAALDDDCVISDLSCIRDQMRRRVDDLESGAYVHSGVYRSAGGLKLLLHPGGANGYRVRIYDPTRLPGFNIVTVAQGRAALWEGPRVMLAEMGDANGLPLPAGDGCILRLQPAALSIQVAQQGGCGGRRYDGSYGRLLGETLRGYDLELY